jgi:hypothetical protein
MRATAVPGPRGSGTAGGRTGGLASLDELQTVLAGLEPGQQATVEATSPDGGKHSRTATLGSL